VAAAVVDHPVLLAKLSHLDLSECVQNWIVSFLVGRSLVVKTDYLFSSQQPIDRGIVQGSGVGPMLYIIMEGDLHTLSQSKVLFKYADDTNLLVPAYSDVSLLGEFDHIKQWADVNKMIINITKTKEIGNCFSAFKFEALSCSPALCGLEQVISAKLLGVIFKHNFNFDEHVTTILKCCSQRAYILKLLRDQGMSQIHLDTVFHALIISMIRCYSVRFYGFQYLFPNACTIDFIFFHFIFILQPLCALLITLYHVRLLRVLNKYSILNI